MQNLPQDKASLNPVTWVMSNQFVTENQLPVEFHSHRFMIEPMADLHPDQSIKKSAQVGESTNRIFKSIWACKHLLANLIYVLPTRKVVDDFVVPKVNPLINSNPAISTIVATDSKSLKQIGNRFLYFNGAFSESEAIMKSADILVLDELDRMANQFVIRTYDSRLQASKLAWRWRLSNPSAVGYGIDLHYAESDQKHWFIRCHHCGHAWFIDWSKSDEKNHYVNQEKGIYACGRCEGELSNEDRINGWWVAKYASRLDKRGYWISQMMASWVSAKQLVKIHNDSSIEFFHNFVLGKAYTPSDVLLDRADLISAISPGKALEDQVAMGVDNGQVKHYVIGNPYGIFRYGKTESWDEIEYLIKRYNATTVIDNNPYPVTPRKLTQQYKGKVFVCFYQLDRKNLGIIKWGEGKDAGVVYADRTKIFDYLVVEIKDKKLVFYLTLTELEQYIPHWTSMYRTIEENALGVSQGKWLTIENKPDHWAHATVYYRLALDKMLRGMSAGVVRRQPSVSHKDVAPTVKDGRIEVAFDLEKAYNLSRQKQQ